jgi:hypothetical protein
MWDWKGIRKLIRMKHNFSEFRSSKGDCHGNEWTNQPALRINTSRDLRNQSFHLTALYAEGLCLVIRIFRVHRSLSKENAKTVEELGLKIPQFHGTIHEAARL